MCVFGFMWVTDPQRFHFPSPVWSSPSLFSPLWFFFRYILHFPILHSDPPTDVSLFSCTPPTRLLPLFSFLYPHPPLCLFRPVRQSFISVSTAVCPSFFLCCEGRRYEKKGLLWGTVRRQVPLHFPPSFSFCWNRDVNIQADIWRDIESQGERCHRNPTRAQSVLFALISTELQTFRRFNCIQ